ncbi:MAG: acyl-CoA ligase (AMP-forming), exosortase A system-associated [Aromatoleum sp.]|jgi:acyl-CoA ligase (AMP-forming) (exosortase A-associated)|uniref:acyl-CoA ligase (AMP-forming), exosortase A system-associated n=1 Tax=Aromatoleum sp. TaxID=2307007 RepID=UPI0028959EBD|nr:acyl-CoA ligase (AMP-forming), exosortase A system-associated [Aromatoleum sp.]MDT3670689.1 acyl-CoA ligase (AMP-forming), exosortase A system-associated [Aromatoleum sp.]
MNATHLLHHLVTASASRNPDARAITFGSETLDYSQTARAVAAFASGLVGLGLARSERVGIFLDKRLETVTAFFGTAAAGGVFVPVNPVLKAEQVGYILRDCGVRVLVTSPERFAALKDVLPDCHDLRHVVLTGNPGELPSLPGVAIHHWNDLLDAAPAHGHRTIDSDMAAILYTSGSTGRPKGVVLSHRNMVVGAKSVAQYLENHPDDTLLAALPLSFDAGFSQLTTAFHSGARVVLLNYLLPRDVLKAVEKEKVTGLTAVPPLWIQLSQLQWPETVTGHLRYMANTGGRMPLDTLTKLRAMLPRTRPFLMYGLTEAFRATYLPPEEADRRPDSIGRAIPNSDVLVLREDGSECAPNEPGELVQRGALVALGYWNDPEKTAERFKPLPGHAPGRHAGIVLPEIAVFSGDTVRRDEDGFLYFIGRRDEMIKTSGYRVSPTEVEEIIYATKLVGECAAFGTAHDTLGQTITVVATPPEGAALDVADLLAECRSRMPAYMVPARIDVREGPLPRNPNGKIDRKALALETQEKAHS